MAKYIVNGAVTRMLLRSGLRYYAGQEAPDNIPERDLKALLESKVLIPAPGAVLEIKPAVASPVASLVVDTAVASKSEPKTRKGGF